MKRRNADCGKLRRPLKRNKITDSFYGSMFMYVKFLLVWLLILLADFILEFRFEYLWPFWLLLRSVYDSFKYQGLAFSVFFVCIALTSDMICFLFIPVHWLFFAASTYVWVQYVWHTDKGVCLPTVSLWLLFVYIEASVRLKELKSLPFHLDLCRPFASHCIGYPMVTLGFGFKSYVGYRMRQRKQKEVAKENEFYMQLVQEALPPEQNCIAASSEKSSTVRSHGDSVPNGVVSPSKRSPLGGHHGHSHSNGSVAGSGGSGHHRNTDSSRFSEVDPREAKKQLLVNTGTALDRELEYMENHLHKRSSINDFDESLEMLDRDKSYKANGVVTSRTVHNTGSAAQTSRWSVHVVTVPTNAAHHHVKDNEENATINSANHNHNHNQQQAGSPQSATAPSVSVSSGGSGRKAKNVSSQACGKEVSAANNVAGGGQKDEHVLRLEADIKRLKADLQASRQCEQDLRSQINSLLNGERLLKSELAHLQQDNDTLQAKLHGLVTARQQDKQTVATLEKKLQEEKRYRSSCEAQLVAERKAAKRVDDANAARVAAASSANTVRIECTESCKQIRRDLENDLKQLRRDIKVSEDRRRQAEREAQSLHQYKDAHNDTEVLMSALSAMQDKHAHLENSLSAETRVKLDLFSALGESTRQNEILQAQLMQKEKEIDELKSKMAEVMAVLPHSAFPPVSVSLDAAIIVSPPYASKFVTEPKIASSSSLDPNASVYTPRGISGNSTDM